MSTTRRSILKTMTAAGALAVWDAPFRFAFANAPTDRRLVVVILRGALDGLAAVPPHGDKDYASVRGNLALNAHDGASLHDLDGFFGLNPGLSQREDDVRCEGGHPLPQHLLALSRPLAFRRAELSRVRRLRATS